MSLSDDIKRVEHLFSEACETAELEKAKSLLCDIDRMLDAANDVELREAEEQILMFSSRLEYYTLCLTKARNGYQEKSSKISVNVRKIGKYVDNC